MDNKELAGRIGSADRVLGPMAPEPVPVSAHSGDTPLRDRLQVLRDMQEAGSTLFRQVIPDGHRCGPIEVSQERWETIEAVQAGEDAALAALMPTEQDAIRLMHDAYTRLKKLGWNDAMYCPKDGSEFDAIEVGSTGIHPTHYTGDWPDGSWWASDGGDLWPSRPCLYRVSEEEKARWEALRGKLGSRRDRDGAEGGDGLSGSGPSGPPSPGPQGHRP